MREPLIVYHANCVDGFTAAWVAHQALGGGELRPAQYGDAPPSHEDIEGRDVYVLDFSYPRAALLEIHAAARSLLVLDHHKTAAADLEGLPFCVFDMERSGAGLSWDHWTSHGYPVCDGRFLVNYVEDRDLWRWRLPRSREISAAIATLETNVNTWCDLARDLDDSLKLARLADSGAAILRYQARVVARHVEAARPVGLGGERGLGVNATSLASEIGNELALRAPFAAMWFQTAAADWVYSLRSSAQNPEAVDVSEIAKRFGGGGHRHAAGFSIAKLVHMEITKAGEP